MLLSQSRNTIFAHLRLLSHCQELTKVNGNVMPVFVLPECTKSNIEVIVAEIKSIKIRVDQI
jgi:hypothetical protein